MSQSGFSASSEAEKQYLPPERSGMPIWPWVLLLVASAVIFLVRWGSVKPQGPEEARGERHPAVGQKVTTFALQPLTGDSREVTEADLAEKVTLVNFWGPWCGACAVEFPHLVEVESHFRSQPGFQFFSISSNYNPSDEKGLEEGTKAFLARYKADFPTYRDPDGNTVIALARGAQLHDFGFPCTVLLGKGGVIRGLWIGFIPGDEDAVRVAIEKALQKS